MNLSSEDAAYELELEWETFRALPESIKGPGVPLAVDFVRGRKYAVLIMGRLGKSLSELLDEWDGSEGIGAVVEKKLMLRYGTHLLRTLRIIHAAGLVHRDIKPNNMCAPWAAPRVFDTYANETALVRYSYGSDPSMHVTDLA